MPHKWNLRRSTYRRVWISTGQCVTYNEIVGWLWRFEYKSERTKSWECRWVVIIHGKRPANVKVEGFKAAILRYAALYIPRTFIYGNRVESQRVPKLLWTDQSLFE